MTISFLSQAPPQHSLWTLVASQLLVVGFGVPPRQPCMSLFPRRYSQGGRCSGGLGYPCMAPLPLSSGKASLLACCQGNRRFGALPQSRGLHLGRGPFGALDPLGPVDSLGGGGRVDGRLGTVAGEMCKEERAESGRLLPPLGLSRSCVVVGVAQGCCLPRGPT